MPNLVVSLTETATRPDLSGSVIVLSADFPGNDLERTEDFPNGNRGSSARLHQARTGAGITRVTTEVESVSTGVRMNIPSGFIGLITSHPDLTERNVEVLNSPMILQSGDTSLIVARLINRGDCYIDIKPGNSIVQVILQRSEEVNLLQSWDEDSLKEHLSTPI